VTTTPNVSIVDAGDQMVSRRVVVDAPVKELFDLVANPHKHSEIDGSGTVHAAVAGPERIALGDKFSVKMSIYRIPYRITSTVTAFEENRLIEWQHPMGHHWRWEFAELGPEQTQVTETFDYRGVRHARFLKRFKYDKINGSGISRTLEGLRARFA
jgi:hypothetical protein